MFRSIFLALPFVALVFSTAHADESMKPFEKLTPADGDAFVFLGDSITAQALYTQYLETYFYTRYPHLRLKFHNAGVSGDTIADALVRFDRDVAAYHPKYVTVLLGMNDGAAERFDEGLFDAYRANMQTLVDKIRDIGATPILISPTMYDLRAKQLNPKPDSRGRGGYYNGVLALYGSWLREFGADRGLAFVDVYGPLNFFTQQSRKTDPNFTLVPDGIHPDAGGHMITAYAVASDLGLSKRCSTIDVARGSDDAAVVKVTGGKVTDARYVADGLEFTFHPASLPLPVPEDARAGASLIPLGHRLSYEAIYLHGLPAGKYTLFINDRPIGDYAAAVLESKLELESIESTPQYQQALRVMELNARRNVEVVVPLRDLWRAQKTLARTRRELAAAPDDAALKKRLTAYERKLATVEDQIAELEAKSREYEEAIYRANRPEALKFRVVRRMP
jgi:lysophospholipase L1-like esterase